jgi:hypothetical protein
VVAFIVTP